MDTVFRILSCRSSRKGDGNLARDFLCSFSSKDKKNLLKRPTSFFYPQWILHESLNISRHYENAGRRPLQINAIESSLEASPMKCATWNCSAEWKHVRCFYPFMTNNTVKWWANGINGGMKTIWQTGHIRSQSEAVIHDTVTIKSSSAHRVQPLVSGFPERER